MAQVWRAKDTVLDRLVAVKILHSHLAVDAGFVARFRREAISSARLSHTSIVAVYDTISDGGVEAIVMELINGKTLRAMLDERPVLPPDQVVSIGRQISDALAEAHRSGIVHRDIKPANIMVDNDQRVVVTDFGIAKANKDADLTHTGTLLGTAKYLAPEQVAGEPVDARADLYSVGVVLFEAATGAPPFKAETDAATALARLQVAAPRCSERVAGIPVDLDNVIATAMARNPEQRYDTADSLKAALEAVNLLNVAPLQPAPVQPAPAYDPAAAGSVGVTGQAPPVHVQAPGGPAQPAAPPSDGTAMMSDSMIMETPHEAKSRGGRDRRRSGRNGPDRRQAKPPRARGWMGRTAVGLLIIAGLLIAGLLALGIGGGFGGLGFGGGVDAGSVQGPATIVQAISYDPNGDDKEEWQQRVGLAYDGDENTRWYTRTYSNTNFSGKGGVGVFYELEEPRTVDSVTITTTTKGWSAEVYVADDLAFEGTTAVVGSPGEFGELVGSTEDVDGSAEIDLDGSEARWVLVWYTESGSTIDRDGNLRNRVEVNELVIS